MATNNPNESFDSLLSPMASIEGRFPALHLTRSSRFARRLGKQLLVLLFVSILGALFVPWQQSIRGEGSVVAFDPNERPQPVYAQVKGRLAERGEGVFENAYVKKGDVLFVIEDQDPRYLLRLEQEVANAKSDLQAAERRLDQARGMPALLTQLIADLKDGLAAEKQAQADLDEANAQFVAQAEQKLGAAKSKVLDAEAKLALASADFERKRTLYEDQEVKLVSELKFQEAEQKHKAAIAGLAIANQGVAEAEAAVEAYKNVRASKWQEWESKINKTASVISKSETELGKAEIDIQKIAGELAEKNTKLQKAERSFEAQKTQIVKAPLDGYILNLEVFEGAPIEAKQKLCNIVPRTESPAVQIWVAGNDAPLIHEGDHVRLQFEGWPAVQFSGWPSVAVGTFGGTVALVDPTDNKKGKFRVLITPDVTDDVTGRPWPESPYLRQGVRANGWVLLDQVPIGYEVWRRMNGFPPSLQSIEAETKSKTSKPPKIKI